MHETSEDTPHRVTFGVLERVEGVNHLIESRRSGSKVSLLGGAFETQRAIDAGRRVASEVKEAMRRPVQASR